MTSPIERAARYYDLAVGANDYNGDDQFWLNRAIEALEQADDALEGWASVGTDCPDCDD